MISSSAEGAELLRAIGGKDGLRSALKKENPDQLVLRFGVDSTSSFVPANAPEDVPCGLVARARLWSSGRCSVELLGPVVEYFGFSQPADFMHLSLQPVVAGELAGEKVLREAPSVPPPVFTKIGSIDQLFGRSAPAGAQRLKRSGSGTIFSAVARFEDPAVPASPLSVVLPAPDETLMELLQRLFKRRPLWLRSAVDEYLPPGYSNWKKRTSFARICYIFSDGPWRGCMCRLGYDPRRHRDARFYQTIDFRDPHYRTISWRTGRRSAQGAGAGAEHALDREKTYGEFAGEVRAPNPELHFLVPPRRPSQLYQLCDVCDAGVQNVVQAPDGAAGLVSAECSKATGWYTGAALAKIRNMMVVKSLRMRHQHKAKAEPGKR